MKQVTYWVAEDGTQFADMDSCTKYERRSALIEFVVKNCLTTYCDDAGFGIIEASDVCNFLIEHSDAIICYLEDIK